MHKKEVIIIGAGGHGKVIEDIIKASGDVVYGFLDDDNSKALQYNLLGNTDEYIKYSDKFFILAIGDNKTRRKIADKLIDVKYYTAIHPFSFISENAIIEAGCVVMPGCVINNSAIVEAHCIINSNSTIEHDCHIKKFSHVSPGAVVCGTVTIEEGVWIGAGAVVKNNISICSDVTVGAGGVVVKHISEPGIYTGVPCKKQK